MVVVDEKRCAGGGYCVVSCPREALEAWGIVRIDRDKCSDCFGGIHDFSGAVSPADRDSVLEGARSFGERQCIINCPADALSVEQD